MLDHTTNAMFDKSGLVRDIQAQFRIDWQGYHGISHWARVRHHGLRIGTIRGADLLVVELFALLHDSQRVNEHRDTRHGERAAEYAAALNTRYFELGSAQLDRLTHAMRFHSDGHMNDDPTIQTCWDADRLDLGRVGIKPAAHLLSADASSLIEEAFEWSRTGREFPT